MSEVTICSLADYVTADYLHELGRVFIPAKRPDERYVKITVTDKIAVKDFGEERKEPITIAAKDFAEDIVGIYRDDSLLKRGVFIAAGSEPTEQELAVARKRMEDYYRKEIREADNVWTRSRNRKEISDRALTAANYFGLKKDWTIDMSQMVPCEACKQLIVPDAIVCPFCPNVRDWDKARKMGLVTKEQYDFATGTKSVETTTPRLDNITASGEMPVKRGRGRPRKNPLATS